MTHDWTPRRPCHDSLVLVKDVCGDLGITPGAIHRAMRRRGKRLPKIGHRAAIPVEQLQAYVATQERNARIVAQRPKGWWNSKRVCEYLGCSPTTLTQYLKAKTLSAVRVAGKYFYNPEEVERVRRQLASVPPGWVRVRDLLLANPNRDEHVLYALVQKMKLDTQQYTAKDAARKRLYICIREGDAARIAERMNRPATYEGYLSGPQVAEWLRVDPQIVRTWHTRYGLEGVKGRHNYTHYEPATVLAYVERRAQTAARNRRAYWDERLKYARELSEVSS